MRPRWLSVQVGLPAVDDQAAVGIHAGPDEQDVCLRDVQVQRQALALA
jgi:hypothetical protein